MQTPVVLLPDLKKNCLEKPRLDLEKHLKGAICREIECEAEDLDPRTKESDQGIWNAIDLRRIADLLERSLHC
jgi:hypothetical protein